MLAEEPPNQTASPSNIRCLPAALAGILFMTNNGTLLTTLKNSSPLFASLTNTTVIQYPGASSSTGISGGAVAGM